MIVSYAVHNKFSKQNLACHACHGPKRMTTHNHHHNSNFLLVFFFCGHNNNKPGTTAWSLEYVISLLLYPNYCTKRERKKGNANKIYLFRRLNFNLEGTS